MHPEKYSSIELNIEELVLHGFAPSERYLVAEAMQSELTRLLVEQGLSAGSHKVEIARVNGGAFDVRPGAKSETIGSQIARQVYRGLRQ